MTADASIWKDTVAHADAQRRRAWLSDLVGGQGATRAPGGKVGGGAPAAKARATASRLKGGMACVAKAMAAMRPTGLTPPQRLRIKRTLQGLALTTTAGVAFASTVIAQAYQEKTSAQWADALATGQMVPIQSNSGALMGGSPWRNTPGLDYQALGFLSDDGSRTPALFKAMLLALEDEHYGSWREVCGIDVLGLAVALPQGRGGSTLAMQTVKQVLQTGGESNLIDKALRKLKEIGYGAKVACDLGDKALLDTYIERVPLVAFGGTTRGLRASSDVVFGKAPEDLSPAQLAVLAAAALYQIKDASLMPQALRDKGCVATTDGTVPEGTKGWAEGKRHCRLIRRASKALERTLPRDKLAEALTELAAMERGLTIQNPWAPISTKRAANMSTRSTALLPRAVLKQLQEDIDASETLPAQGLVVNLSDDHARFQLAVHAGLRVVEKANTTSLCSKLTFKGPVLPCVNAPLDLAETVLLRAHVPSGAVDRLYSTYPAGPQRQMTVGSVAKLISALAAIRAGMNPNTPVCARRATRNGMPLLRVTRPREGFADCNQAGAMISLERAIETSDSLAIFEVNHRLGEEALRQSALDLGLPIADAQQQRGSMSYQLAFGTFVATPMDMLEMGRRLAAAAYRWPVAGPLTVVQNPGVQMDAPKLPLGLSVPQSQSLRSLLAAPVQAGGTMGWARNLAVAGGKSGTTSSTRAPRPNARPYAAGKLNLLITHKGEVALSVVHQPNPPLALGIDTLQGGVFEPVVAALLKPHPATTTKP